MSSEDDDLCECQYGRVVQELTSADDLTALRALRGRLAVRINRADASELPALANVFLKVQSEQRRLGAGRRDSPLDEISARRAQRRSARAATSPDPGSATAGGDSRA